VTIQPQILEQYSMYEIYTQKEILNPGKRYDERIITVPSFSIILFDYALRASRTIWNCSPLLNIGNLQRFAEAVVIR